MKKIALAVLAAGLALSVSVPAMAQSGTKGAKPGLNYDRGPQSAAYRAWIVQRQKMRAQWAGWRMERYKFRLSLEPLRTKKRILKMELKILLLKTPVNMSAVTAKIRQIAAIKTKMALVRIKFFLSMKKKYPELARRLKMRRGWGRRGRGRAGFRCPSGSRFRGGFHGRGRGYRRGRGGYGHMMRRRGMGL